MRMNRTVSSADAHLNDNVDFETLDDVKLGETVVIPKGSTAMATVTEAIPKRRMARGGKLNMSIDYVRLPGGDKLPLRGIQDAKGGGHTGAMTGAIVVTSIVFFPAAPFFLFMHGKDITIPKGHEITVYTNTDFVPRGAATTATISVGSKMLSGSPMTNADVIKLTAAGLSEQIVIDKIKSSPAKFDLETNDIVELKRGGVTDIVIAAMMQAAQR